MENLPFKLSKQCESSRTTFLAKWLNKNFIVSTETGIPRSLVYLDYEQHCENTELMNQATFGKVIRAVFPQLQTRRLGTRGNSKYHYFGISPAPGRKTCITEKDIVNLNFPHTQSFTSTSKRNHRKIAARSSSVYDNTILKKYRGSNSTHNQNIQPIQMPLPFSSNNKASFDHLKFYKQSLEDFTASLRKIRRKLAVYWSEKANFRILEAFANIYYEHCVKMASLLNNYDLGGALTAENIFWDEIKALKPPSSSVSTSNNSHNFKDSIKSNYSIDSLRQSNNEVFYTQTDRIQDDRDISCLNSPEVARIITIFDRKLYDYVLDNLYFPCPFVDGSIDINMIQMILQFGMQFESIVSSHCTGTYVPMLEDNIFRIKMNTVRYIFEQTRRISYLARLAHSARVTHQVSPEIIGQGGDFWHVDWNLAMEHLQSLSFGSLDSNSEIYNLFTTFIIPLLQGRVSLSRWASNLNLIITSKLKISTSSLPSTVNDDVTGKFYCLDKNLNFKPNEENQRASLICRGLMEEAFLVTSALTRQLSSKTWYSLFHNICLYTNECIFYFCERHMANLSCNGQISFLSRERLSETKIIKLAGKGGESNEKSSRNLEKLRINEPLIDFQESNLLNWNRQEIVNEISVDGNGRSNRPINNQDEIDRKNWYKIRRGFEGEHTDQSGRSLYLTDQSSDSLPGILGGNLLSKTKTQYMADSFNSLNRNSDGIMLNDSGIKPDCNTFLRWMGGSTSVGKDSSTISGGSLGRLLSMEDLFRRSAGRLGGMFSGSFTSLNATSCSGVSGIYDLASASTGKLTDAGLTRIEEYAPIIGAEASKYQPRERFNRCDKSSIYKDRRHLVAETVTGLATVTLATEHVDEELRRLQSDYS